MKYGWVLVLLLACQSKSAEVNDKPKDPWNTTPAGDPDAPPTLASAPGW